MARAFVLPLFASLLALSAFLRTSGAENVRAVQMVSLIAVGMGIGVALAHVKLIVSSRSRSGN